MGVAVCRGVQSVGDTVCGSLSVEVAVFGGCSVTKLGICLLWEVLVGLGCNRWALRWVGMHFVGVAKDRGCSGSGCIEWGLQ